MSATGNQDSLPGLIIAIDGPAGAGKSSAARHLATRLGLPYLDTGAMFRAHTAHAMELGLDLRSEAQLLAAIDRAQLEMSPDQRVIMNGRDLSADIRRPDVTNEVHHLASNASVRARLLDDQRRIALQWRKLVCDGRDVGTVVFPKADVKFFLTARIDERARRREQELRARKLPVPPRAELENAIRERDERDENRAVAPLKMAEDAILIDNSELDLQQTVELMLSHIRNRTDVT